MAVVPSRSPSDLTGHDVVCRSARSPAEVAVHTWIRHCVFVLEQGLFVGTDHDDHDSEPSVHHVLGFVDGVPAGTVRFYEVPAERPGERLWQGDRLAVLVDFRHTGIGGPLVRHAVATAGELGGDRMVANIQLANVAFFRRLGWTPVGEPFSYVGEPHQRMTIDLAW